MTATVRLEGFKELEGQLEKLSRAAGKAALRRALLEAAEPMARKMRQRAPTGDDYNLVESIGVGTRLTKRQAGLHRKMFRNDKASVEVFVGAGADPASWTQEFGTINHGPQAFARPAWDEDKNAMLDRLKVEMWDQISRALDRAAARAARG